MLNKQRSQKSNMWKFGIVLPLLMGFIVSFQTTTVAQVKKVENQSEKGLFEHVYSINKSSSDAEITEIKSSIEQNGGTFTHSLKRNAKGEITELELQIKNKGTGRFTSTVPFSECYFGTTKDGIFVADNKKAFNGLKTRMLLRKVTSTKVNDSSNGVAVRSSSGDKPLIIIDGKEKPKADMKKIDLEPEDIQSINVLKDDAALEKYGDKGKNGVIEIVTTKED